MARRPSGGARLAVPIGEVRILPDPDAMPHRVVDVGAAIRRPTRDLSRRGTVLRDAGPRIGGRAIRVVRDDRSVGVRWIGTDVARPVDDHAGLAIECVPDILGPRPPAEKRCLIGRMGLAGECDQRHRHPLLGRKDEGPSRGRLGLGQLNPHTRRPERRRSRDAASGDKLCPTLPRSGPGRQTGCYRTRVHSATTELAYAIHPVEPAEPRVPRSTSSLTKRGTHHDREPAPGRIAPGGAECSQGRLPLGILPRPRPAGPAR
jgi:hypothetical protein